MCAAHDAARRQPASWRHTCGAVDASPARRALSAVSSPGRRGSSSSMLLRRAMALALVLAAAALWPPSRHPSHACASAAGRAPHVTTRGHPKKLLVGLGCHSFCSTSKSTTPGPITTREAPMAAAAGDLRSQYRDVLLNRRREHRVPVPITVEQGSPVQEPLYQGNGPLVPSEAMESCPRKEVENFKEKLVEENFYLMTESGEQGRVPVLLLKLNDTAPQRKPVVVILHSSYKCKEWLRPLLEAYASRGYISVAIDSRYHGERASNKTTYIDALKSSWKNGDTMPFIFDTVWDLIRLGDYLCAREDVDPSRIGITGESLGGMHAWFAAFVDTRYSVVVPIIGVQGFRWAIDNNKWQARVNSINPLFEEARIDLGKSEIDAEVVEKVWDQIAPGMASQFDAPYSVPLIAPRPLLLINGADDPRCPVLGLQEPTSKAAEAYEEAGCAEKFKFIAEPGVDHRMTAFMVKEASDWFDRFL